MDGISTEFRTLKDAIEYCDDDFTLDEKLKYIDGYELYNIINGELAATYVIHVDCDGKLSIDSATD